MAETDGVGRGSHARCLFAVDQSGGRLLDPSRDTDRTRDGGGLQAMSSRRRHLRRPRSSWSISATCSLCRGFKRSRWADRSVHESRRRDSQRPCRFAGIYVQSIDGAPAAFRTSRRRRPGVMKLACDIHQHMRGYVVVSPTPVGDGLRSRRAVSAQRRCRRQVHPDSLARDGRSGANRDQGRRGQGAEVPQTWCSRVQLGPGLASSAGGSDRATAPVRPWPDVIDRISVILAASRDAATRPGELAKARRLADDAYWGEFESSDMETAVRKYLGFGRAGACSSASSWRSGRRPVMCAEKRQAAGGDGRTFLTN